MQITISQNKWDKRFLEMAKLVASWSKDPSLKVGAIIVRPDKTVAGVGFNGFPKGMPDDEALYQDRSEKLSRIVHAEINALVFCRENPSDYTLYTWPVLCCDRCAVQVIQSGIKRVVAPNDVPERWRESINRACEYFDESRVEVVLI